jgi:hypothetical protein
VSGFRDDLGAARQRQEDLERENAELRAELEKERKVRDAEREARAKERPATAPLPRWLFLVLGATVLSSGLSAFWLSRRDEPQPLGAVTPPPVQTGDPGATASVGFTAPPPTTPAPAATAAWSPVALPEKVPLHGLAAGLDVVYAVGDRGTILRRHRSEDVWTKESSATAVSLRSVAVLGERVMACGDDGTIVTLPNQSTTSFHPRPSGTKKTLRAIAMSSFGVLAVGDEGTIVRGSWIVDDALTIAKSPTTKTLRGICSGLGDSWVVGDGGTLLHVTLTGIEVVESGTTENLNAVECDMSKVVAVGDHGVVTQRSDPRAKFVVSREGDADWLSITSYYGMATWVASGRGANLSSSWASKRGGLTGDIERILYSSMGTFAVGSDGLFIAR